MNFSHNLRLFFTYFIVFITVTSGVVTVFGTDLVFNAKIKKIETLGKNIFLDDKKLKSTYIFYTSDNDLSSYNLKSSCQISSKFSGKIGNKYFFKITYLNECFYGLTYLQADNKTILKDSKIKLKVFNKSRLFDFFVDRNNKSLNDIKTNIENNILKLEKQISNNTLLKLQIDRRILELEYQKEFLKNIMNFRKEKYLIPVLGNYKLPTNKNEIPNAGRPYRSSYTDGIHHGWDIDTPINTPVISIDYGKVVRIINDFKFSDLNKINKLKNITKEDKLSNLNLLRGNQVWLKTTTGDVIFYSHLSSVTKDIKVGDIVQKGAILGKIGISGVPDKNYKKYHLHFTIQKNPYIKNKVGKYTFMDYMKWNWYFKGKSLKYVLENQNNIFK